MLSRPPSKSRATSIRTLVRLRWLAIASQAVIVGAVSLLWDVEWPLAGLLAILGTTAVTNVLLPRVQIDPERVIGAVVVLDAMLLTGLLALTGGPSNPFSVLYLVHVMLAAIITSPPWMWTVVAMSSAGFGLLFFAHVPLPAELGGHDVAMMAQSGPHAGHAMMGHDAEPAQSFSAHLQGMWLAYTIAAIVIGAFVSRLATSLRLEREELARASQLLGLATLAAGAAHEIGNPLATIRVAATELERDLSENPANREMLEDLRLINAEVDRAQGVLERMATGAGELAGEAPVPIEAQAVMALAITALGSEAERIDLEIDKSIGVVRWPVQASAQALTQFLRNAAQASPAGEPVTCRLRPEDGGVRIEIRDRGEGMSEQTLVRLGEPFYTTRPGGMGLGVFIARSLVDLLGGTLQVSSHVGKGTEVVAWLPLEVRK